jgi:hypothetical protein
MSACMTPPPGAPIITLTLVGTGEPLLRLEKRHATLQPEPMARTVRWREPPGHEHE